jgi:hypothetical protein
VSFRFRWSLCILLTGFATAASMASGPFKVLPEQEVGVEMEEFTVGTANGSLHTPSRVLAATLAITLGPFGAHRILMGTSPVVPVLYSVTFGGFGLLVLIDLGHILFTRDLSSFTGNEQVLMWASGPDGSTPP